MALNIRYIDPATIGSNLVANVFRMEDGTVWDNAALQYISPSPRTSDMNVALTENGAFAGLHEVTVEQINADEDLIIRIEDSTDIGVPIGVLYNTVSTSTIVASASSSADSSGTGNCLDLDTPVPGTDIGDGNFTVGEVLEALLATAIGRIRIDRTKRWVRFYHLNNSALRTLSLVQNAAESERNPPGQGGPDPGD